MSNRKFFIILALFAFLRPLLMNSIHSIQATISSYMYTGYYLVYDDRNVIESSKFDFIE